MKLTEAASILLLLVFAPHVIAEDFDYVAARAAAVEIDQTGTEEEAVAAFLKMADADISDFQKSDALEQAVLRLIRLKDYDRATEISSRIPMAQVSKLCRMRILNSRRDYKALLEEFGSEDIDAWSDDLKADAFSVRALAAYSEKNGELARADYEKAIRYEPVHHARASLLNSLGYTHRNLLNDDDKALECHRKVHEVTTYSSRRAQASISAANILLGQQRLEEALEELMKVPQADAEGSYRDAELLRSRGGILEALGRTNEAMSAYQAVLNMKGARDSTRTLCRESIAGLKE